MNRILEEPLDRPIEALADALRVQRTGIHFRNVARDLVQIEIEVENPGDAPSRPTTLRVGAAPFGAFVDGRPLATLAVPALPPRSRTQVMTLARQPRPQPVASFAQLVPPEVAAPARKSLRQLLFPRAPGDAQGASSVAVRNLAAGIAGAQ